MQVPRTVAKHFAHRNASGRRLGKLRNVCVPRVAVNSYCWLVTSKQRSPSSAKLTMRGMRRRGQKMKLFCS